jgi:S-disulfanyl-L-cysteine oxidoreductase SoxD
MRDKHLLLLVGTLLISACSSGFHQTQSYGLGKPITESQILAWNIDIAPNGDGLPPGGATAQQGEKVYQEKCGACHGNQGQGGVGNRLVGGGGLNTDKPIKTVGSYWPYATTLFDYTKRAMPHPMPQSLTNQEVYGTTAYILYMNKIIGLNDEMNAKTLPLVKMPNRDGFIPVLR